MWTGLRIDRLVKRTCAGWANISLCVWAQFTIRSLWSNVERFLQSFNFKKFRKVLFYWNLFRIEYFINFIFSDTVITGLFSRIPKIRRLTSLMKFLWKPFSISTWDHHTMISIRRITAAISYKDENMSTFSACILQFAFLLLTILPHSYTSNGFNIHISSYVWS